MRQMCNQDGVIFPTLDTFLDHFRIAHYSQVCDYQRQVHERFNREIYGKHPERGSEYSPPPSNLLALGFRKELANEPVVCDHCGHSELKCSNCGGSLR